MAMEQPKTKSCNTTPNESILRVSFLEQAAALLAITPAESQTSSTQQSQSPQQNTRNLVSRLLLRELRECAFVDQLRMHRDFKRSHCRKCFQSWISYDSRLKNSQIKLKRRHWDAIVRVCGGCGSERRFATSNPNYRSRNEKTGNL